MKASRSSLAQRGEPCPPKLALGKRAALEGHLLEHLARVFGVLSSTTRIRILHTLARAGELHVQEIARRLGMKMAAVSNQLRLMSMQGILGARPEGLRVYYSLGDPCAAQILETGACLASDSQGRKSPGRSP